MAKENAKALGIGSAPLLAWLLMAAGNGWRQYYQVLAVPGILLGVYFLYPFLLLFPII